MTYAEQEIKLIKEIEIFGLHREIRHIRGTLNATVAFLYDEKEYKSTKNTDKKPTVLYSGYSYVHPNDQFCRAKGRLIATGRALKNRRIGKKHNPKEDNLNDKSKQMEKGK
jgi:hypothetical protein